MTRRRRAITSVLFAIIGTSCSTSTPPRTDDQPVGVTLNLTLTTRQPSACVRLALERVVDLAVTALTNPSGQGLELHVRDLAGTVVSVVAIYPPTAPQTFRIPMRAGDFNLELVTGRLPKLGAGTLVDLAVGGVSRC